MIKLDRERTAAAILEKYRGKKRVRYNLELLKQQQEILKGAKSTFTFNKMWKEAKTQLMKEANYKCAYCEKKIDMIGENEQESSFADVEHYRPKSIYWWLTYCYDNYLYACEICNRTYKSDDFPTLNVKQTPPIISAKSSNPILQNKASAITPDPLNQKQGQKWSKFRELHEKERPFILNPYFDEPKDFIIYEVDEILKEVRLRIKPTTSHLIDYQDAIDKTLGVNRLFLRQDRFSHYEHWKMYKDLLTDNISQPNRNTLLQKIREMQRPDYPYSGMIRYFESQSTI